MVTGTEAGAMARRGFRRPGHAGVRRDGGLPGPGWRGRIAVGTSLAIAVVGAVLCLRARANYVACACVPLIVPGLLLVFSGASRAWARRAIRRGWIGLESYASGGSTPWASVLALVVVPFFLVALANDRVEVITDTTPVVPTAISLITEGNTDLDEFYGRNDWWRTAAGSEAGVPWFLQRRGDRLYSGYPAGMVPLALPVVALSGLSGGRLADLSVQMRLEKLTAALVGASAMGLFLLIALRLARPVPALVATALVAVGSGMLSTVGQNLWQHGGIILGSLVLLLVEFRGPGRRGVVLQGVACARLPACRLTAAGFLIPFGAWVLVRSPRCAAMMVGVAALAYLPWAGYYLATYGSPFGPSSVQMAGSNWSVPSAESLTGVLASPGRGLLVYQPWIALAFLGLIPSVRRGGGRAPSGWEAVCVSAIAMEILIVSAWICWWGGWCWGSRLAVGIVPLAGLLCVRPIAALMATVRGRLLVAALGILGLMVQVPGVYSDGFRWNRDHQATIREAVWSWPDAPFLAPIRRADAR